jgi:hypothetical protein
MGTVNRFPFKLNLLYTLFPLFLLVKIFFSVLACIGPIAFGCCCGLINADPIGKDLNGLGL